MDKKLIAEYAESFFNLFRKEGITDSLFILNQAICFFFLKKEEYGGRFRDKSLNLFGDETLVCVSWHNMKNIENYDFVHNYLTDVIPQLDKQIICNYKLTSFLNDAKLYKFKTSLVLYNSFVLMDKMFTYCESDNDTKVITSYDFGNMFEEFLQYYQSSLKEGFTIPMHISRLMSELSESNVYDLIYTPVLGDGELLVSTYQKIVGDSTPKEKIQHDLDGFANGDISVSNLSSEQLKKIVLNGNQEKDEDMFLTIMNFYFHGISLPQAFTAQRLLSSEFRISPSKYSKIIAAVFPPITVKKHDDIDKNLKQAFGSNRPTMVLDRCLEQLAEDGRLVALVPESFLSAHDKAVANFRKTILEHYQLEAIISLPKGVFANYSNIKTSIIVLTKHHVPSYSVWMCELKNDGYSLNSKRAKNTEIPLPKLVENFKGRVVNNDSLMDVFLVPIETILNHRSSWVVQFYNDYETVEESTEDPKEILREIFKLEGIIDSELRDLSTLLGDGEIFG